MKPHNSMRGFFAYHLYQEMLADDDIYVICVDLGYGMFNEIKNTFPTRFINPGAAEQAAMDIAIGMALAGKKPFIYSITPFLIYRAFESIRTYINHEAIPVRMIGSGRDDDYKKDGWSHHADDVLPILSHMSNIQLYFPNKKEKMEAIVKSMVNTNAPQFLSLRR